MTRQVCTTIAPSDRADRMNVWRAVWRLVRFAPWLFVANALIWIVEDFFYLARGLVLRQIFDTLTDHAQLNVGFWALLALLPALSGIQTLLVVGGTATGATFHGTVGALLRKNLFARILRRPGARALPGSPGEAVSRFGGDVAEITGLSEDVVDSFGNIAAAIAALVIMLTISPLATIAVLVPLIAIRVASALVRRRLEATRRASREATGQVTGFIGEVFGAALAVKVNTAERQVVEHFRGLGEGRRRAELQNMLLNELVRRSWSLTDSLATGLILLLVGSSLQDGTFTVGDFALFVSYIGTVGGGLNMVGHTLVDATQAKVSWQRLVELLQGDAPPSALVAHGPVYMRGAFPSIPHITKTATHRLDALDVDGADVSLSRVRPGNHRGQSASLARLVHGHHRADRLREEHTTPCPLGPPPPRCRRNPLERRADCRPGRIPRTAAGGLHATGTTALQRNLARQYPLGLVTGSGGTPGCPAHGGTGTRRGGIDRWLGHGDWPAGSQALRRAGAAHRRRAYARARPGAAGLR